MEGPSIRLAAEYLAPFVGGEVLAVEGNTRIGKERLVGRNLIAIFSWGKHLVFQFDEFALRVHFLLFGSYEAFLHDQKIVGDYPKKSSPRLTMILPVGQIVLYSCSVKFLETANASESYDFSTDIMSSKWNTKKALRALSNQKDEEIGDVLLDQEVFSGVGNIIKNEVLFIVKRRPTHLIRDLSSSILQKIVKTTQTFSHQFYEWRKQFVLKKHYQIYRKRICPKCGEKVSKMTTGKWQRVSYFCAVCQR